MVIGRRRLVSLAATFALAPAVSRVAFAQAWPSRPVRIVVPYAPGGSTDTVARITADRLSSIWAQQLVIENKPGAGTNIGGRSGRKLRPRRLHDVYRLIVPCNQPPSLPLAALRHQRSCTGYPGVHVSSLDVGA